MVKEIAMEGDAVLYKAAVPPDAVKQRTGGVELRVVDPQSLSDFPAS